MAADFEDGFGNYTPQVSLEDVVSAFIGVVGTLLSPLASPMRISDELREGKVESLDVQLDQLLFVTQRFFKRG